MRKTLVFIFFISIIICGCERKFGTYYDAPKGQYPYIYQQLAADSRFSTFVSAIDKVTGLKQELSTSGLFTIMAPDNDAFTDFFASQSYKSLDAIPADSLALMVKYHIMKWMFFATDFLNPGLDLKSFNFFKYLTRANITYKDISFTGRPYNIYYPSKMLQIYTPAFQTFYNVTDQDLMSVYGSAYNSIATQFHVMGAVVKEADIASGNGVIHVINKVLVPPSNIAQELQTNYPDYYNLLAKRFVTYSYNSGATIAQGNNGDVNGDGLVDSLWSRSYKISSFLDDENPVTTDTKAAFSLTAYIPAKSAFNSYLNSKILPGFDNSIDSVPSTTLLMLYKFELSENLYWPSMINAGRALTTGGDKMAFSTSSDVNSIKMKSNGLFYELNKVVEPPVFTCVTGPAFLQSKYSWFAEMVNQAGAVNQLTFPGSKYTLLCPTNKALLLYGFSWVPNAATPAFYRLLPPATIPSLVSVTTMRQIVQGHLIPGVILNQSSLTDGFYLTNYGTYIQIKGGKLNGADKDTLATITDPDVLRSNGYFHGIDRMLMVPSQSIFTIINSASVYTAAPPLVTPEYTKFKELITAAGINAKDFASTNYLAITSVDVNKKFTMFVPSNNAITAAQTLGLLPKTGAVTPVEPVTSGVITDVATRDRLAAYIRYFFIPDNQIFTDGKTTGTFSTTKRDPILYSPSNPVYKKVLITYSAGNLKFNEVGGSNIGNVDMSQPSVFPQNKFATDGVILIIDNAFTSQY